MKRTKKLPANCQILLHVDIDFTLYDWSHRDSFDRLYRALEKIKGADTITLDHTTFAQYWLTATTWRGIQTESEKTRRKVVAACERVLGFKKVQ